MKTILVVDDQPNIRDLVEQILVSEDRRILAAESGERGIELAVSARPDLIILDLIMPEGIQGLDVLKILKSDARTRKCPVLVMTAWNQEKAREQVLELGAAAYISKPFKLDVLEKKVEELTV